jgi:hypothetical protein
MCLGPDLYECTVQRLYERLIHRSSRCGIIQGRVDFGLLEGGLNMMFGLGSVFVGILLALTTLFLHSVPRRRMVPVRRLDDCR